MPSTCQVLPNNYLMCELRMVQILSRIQVLHLNRLTLFQNQHMSAEFLGSRASRSATLAETSEWGRPNRAGCTFPRGTEYGSGSCGTGGKTGSCRSNRQGCPQVHGWIGSCPESGRKHSPTAGNRKYPCPGRHLFAILHSALAQ